MKFAKLCITGLIVVIAQPALAAQQSDGTEISPSLMQARSGWIIKPATDRCTISSLVTATEGRGSPLFVISLSQLKSNEFELSLEGHSYDLYIRPGISLTVALNGNAIGVAPVVLGTEKDRVSMLLKPGSDFAQRFQIASKLAITTSGQTPYQIMAFPLSGNSAGLSLLAACHKSLPTGIAPAQPANSPPTPKTDRGKWISLDELFSAAKEQAVGPTKYDLAVDAEGRVTECTIVQGAGNMSFEGAICRKLLGKGLFLPATDATGRSVAGTFRYALSAIPASGY